MPRSNSSTGALAASYRDKCKISQLILEAALAAMGSAIISDEIRGGGAVDTAMVVMRMRSGALCHINCFRRSVYGRDQQVEAFCSQGMVIENNRTAATVDGNNRTAAQELLADFSIERKQESYLAEVRAFVDAVEKGGQPSPAFEDGRRALIVANAAVRSLETGPAVKVDYDE